MASETKRADLASMRPAHDTLVGIDSDGCVFDTMDIKQKTFFHPLIVTIWGLEPIERQVRQAAEFFNLYSRFRGENRFLALLRTFQALPHMPGVRTTGVALPSCAALERYVRSGLPLGNPSLEQEAHRTGDRELERLLAWSLAVNRDIEERMQPVPPFAWARRGLERMARDSDLIVVSQTPTEALVKEWREHGLDGLVRAIAGQELGKKSEHLEQAMRDRYPPERVLMIGDAPGDARAAAETGARFYPILPGREEECWQRLHDDVYPLFREGGYDTAAQARYLEAFEASLPKTPAWQAA